MSSLQIIIATQLDHETTKWSQVKWSNDFSEVSGRRFLWEKNPTDTPEKKLIKSVAYCFKKNKTKQNKTKTKTTIGTMFYRLPCRNAPVSKVD